MQVTRQRRPSRAHLRSLDRRRRLRIVAAGTTVGVVASAGAAYATTTVFGHHQVGTTYPNGIQVSDNQIIKPIGKRLVTPYGKFMGSTVSPDGRFLAASSTDKSVALQVFDLSTYKLIYTVGSASFVDQRLSDGTRGPGGPDLLSGREIPLASPGERPDPLPGQRRRHAGHGDVGPAPDGG